LSEPLSEEEVAAYVELVREVKAEAIAAGENRSIVLKWLDDQIDDVLARD
jgi:hypothetical protein